MIKYYYLTCVVFLICSDLYAESQGPSPSPVPAVVQSAIPSNEKEYSDAVVVLVDAKSGMIGLSWTDEETQKEEKLSFKVDTAQVDVYNAMNTYLEFSSISVGDHVDLVTIKDPHGTEKVVEIMDYNAVEREA